jgi:hypothetical protein
MYKDVGLMKKYIEKNDEIAYFVPNVFAAAEVSASPLGVNILCHAVGAIMMGAEMGAPNTLVETFGSSKMAPVIEALGFMSYMEYAFRFDRNVLPSPAVFWM